MSLPFLDTTKADVFESPGYLCGKYPSLTNTVCVALLKIRLMMDLEALGNVALLGGKLPQELLDRVKDFVPRSEIIRKNNKVMSSTDHTYQLGMLCLQLDNLFSAITKANKHLLPALINPGENLGAQPEAYSMGSKQEMQLKLQYWFDAWNETPGAIDFVKAEVNTGIAEFLDSME
ncbi:MAG: hypothetical protein Q9188_002693 [Gyalolechia gomerana]